MTKAQLNSDFVGPENDEYDRIEAASAVVTETLAHAAQARGRKLWWSWGDSNGWRVIIGIPTEDDLSAMLANEAGVLELAQELIELIGSVVALNIGFELCLELDSDERVNANEGWFFRVRSDAQLGRELVFILSGEGLSRA